MPELQATAIVNALVDAAIGQLATKADLEILKGKLKALNSKVNIMLAFNTPLLFAVLALLWRSFFVGAVDGSPSGFKRSRGRWLAQSVPSPTSNAALRG